MLPVGDCIETGFAAVFEMEVKFPGLERQLFWIYFDLMLLVGFCRSGLAIDALFFLKEAEAVFK